MNTAELMNGTTFAAALSAEARALASRHADELRETWQAKVMAAAHGKMGAIIVTMLAHNYFEVMDVLMRVVLPGVRISPPCFTGTASISKSGRVICNMIDSNNNVVLGIVVFDSEDDMVWQFRFLADRIKLNDKDRKELFAAIQNWVVVDRRIPVSQPEHDA